MKIRKNEIVCILIVFAIFLSTAYVYPILPENMASHWNISGETDGYISKLWGAFLMPIILAGVLTLFIIIPRIDPLKNNIIKFIKYYDMFVIVFIIFILLLHMQIILWNIGYEISPNSVLPIGFAFLFYFLGILCENAQRNWSIGMRTPWTLSSEKVWKKTNKLAGKLLKISAAICLLGIVFQDYAVYFILIPVIIFMLYSFVYSYFEYKKLEKN